MRTFVVGVALLLDLTGCGGGVTGGPGASAPSTTTSPTPSATATGGTLESEDGLDPTSDVCEVGRGWPSTSRNPPGLYSWDGPGPGGDSYHLEGFMHNGYGSGDVEIFLDDVVPTGVIPDDGATAVTVAGHEGLYRQVDARQEEWAFDIDWSTGPIDAQREEWIVDIEGTTIAIHLTARPGTSQADLADAHAIIGSMRADPCNNEIGFVLVFTITTNDWDSG